MVVKMRVGYDLIDGMASRGMAWQGKAAGMFALVAGKNRCGCVLYDKSRGMLCHARRDRLVVMVNEFLDHRALWGKKKAKK